MNNIRAHFRNFFYTQHLYIFRFRDGNTWRDQKRETLEEVRSLAFRKKMNQPNTEYAILKGIQDAMFKRILKFEIRFPGILQMRARIFRKPIPAYYLVLTFVAVLFVRFIIRAVV